MAPSDTPKKTPPRKSSTSKSTEGRNHTQTSSDTPRLSSRERKPHSLSLSASNTSTRTLRSQGSINDSDLLASGMDSAHDESSSPSPGPSQASQRNDQPSSSANGNKQSGLKKRRRLSVRPDISQLSRSDIVASTADQNIPPDLAPMTSNRPLLASFLNRRSNQSRWLGYADAQVQTVFSDGESAENFMFFSEDEDSELPLSLSGLIPGTFDAHKHNELLKILRGRAPYFFPQLKQPVQESPTIPGTKYPMPPQWDPPAPPNNPLGPNSQGWPPNVIPIEIFEQIASSLSRDDMLNMRLVDHEFEAKISSRIFQTVVVPFKPDIYGVIGNNKGKSVATADSARSYDHGVRITRTSPGRPLSDGMEVFRSWGKRIKKFALTFELDEETFFQLPAKDYFEKQVSFWGQYRWPRTEYTRFKSCEQLEKKADETRCMTLALSQLTSLNELGLAIDSGLGWIEGPDCSDRVHLFREKQRIFGTTYSEMSWGQRNKQWIWDAVSFEVKHNRALTQERFEARQRGTPNQYEPTTFQTIHGPYHESHAIPNLQWAQVPVQDVYPPLVFRGLDIERGVKDINYALCKSSYPSDALIPNELKYSHIEWLMENEWAQQAFLTSLTISVTDNASNFRNIQTLNIAKVSSRYLSALSNKDFWAALPNVQTLKMFVSPDWRDIVRGSDELLQAAMICPSSAGPQFFDFLDSCVAKRENITSLDIGWLGGGERATGLFARNQHILPAPVLSITDPEGAYLSCKVLKLPFVKHLTLSNCWFHPSALKVFVRRMEQASLQTLKLDSVSLTATAGNNAANSAATVQVAHHNIQAPAFVHVIPVHHNFQAPPAGPTNLNIQNATNAGLIAHIQAQNGGIILPPQLLAPAGGTFQLQSPPANANGSQSQDTLGSLNTFHPYMQHPGRSTVHASVPPGGHLSHWATEQLGPDNECLELPLRNGAWGEVIDKITPGTTIDQQRALLNHSVTNPQKRKSTSLKSIEFVSCGYVRLVHHPALVQNTVPEVMSQPPRCLRHRHKILSKIMMRADHDVLLGTIAPAMPQPESDVLQVAFNMRMGWEEDDMTQYETREDGQPIGGSGRFSGIVARSNETVDED